MSEHGFELSWDPTIPFEARYRRGTLELRVEGVHYGFGAALSLLSAGERLPWILEPLLPSKTRATGVPQLDEVREWARRTRSELGGFLAGDLSAFEAARERLAAEEQARSAARAADPKGTFFGRAHKLWKNRKLHELVTLLDASPYPLSATWRERLADARAKL
ncbi:MAG: hypothetical protein L6Q99_15020 [Planctomycetes bacterium]|nr:hypothetical protein [Planctomycetota bacterium]